jgi:hypothetical protein
MNRSTVRLALILVTTIAGAFVSKAHADPYWSIEETYTSLPWDPPHRREVHYYFDVTNGHPTRSVTAFGVGIRYDKADIHHSMVGRMSTAQDPDLGWWHSGLIAQGEWNSPQSSYLNAGQPMVFADYFGLSWNQIFAGYPTAVVTWSGDDPPFGRLPGRILPGASLTVFAELSFADHVYGGPGSPCVVKLDSGTVFTGETDEINTFETIPIPAPGATLLASLGTGLAGVVLRRRMR